MLLKQTKAAYPAQSLPPESALVFGKFWLELCETFGDEVLTEAARRHILNCKFMPTIAEINALCAVVKEEIRKKKSELLYELRHQRDLEIDLLVRPWLRLDINTQKTKEELFDELKASTIVEFSKDEKERDWEFDRAWHVIVFWHSYKSRKVTLDGRRDITYQH